MFTVGIYPGVCKESRIPRYQVLHHIAQLLLGNQSYLQCLPCVWEGVCSVVRSGVVIVCYGPPSCVGCQTHLLTRMPTGTFSFSASVASSSLSFVGLSCSPTHVCTFLSPIRSLPLSSFVSGCCSSVFYFHLKICSRLDSNIVFVPCWLLMMLDDAYRCVCSRVYNGPGGICTVF